MTLASFTRREQYLGDVVSSGFRLSKITAVVSTLNLCGRACGPRVFTITCDSDRLFVDIRSRMVSPQTYVCMAAKTKFSQS